MKANLEGRIAVELSSPVFRDRFLELFGVASKKSIISWIASDVKTAQVIVVNDSHDMQLLLPLPPCIIWIGRNYQDFGKNGPWTSSLSTYYTVADLIDMLDRAAVFLLDWKASRPIADVEPTSPSIKPNGLNLTPSSQFRIGSWVFLEPPFDAPEFISAQALMARQPVTLQQLQEYGGLSPTQVIDLLHELARRGVLLLREPNGIDADALGSAQETAHVGKGFVVRLSHWLKGMRRS